MHTNVTTSVTDPTHCLYTSFSHLPALCSCVTEDILFNTHYPHVGLLMYGLQASFMPTSQLYTSISLHACVTIISFHQLLPVPPTALFLMQLRDKEQSYALPSLFINTL